MIRRLRLSHLRDTIRRIRPGRNTLSIRHQLLVNNFIMVFVPIFLLLVISTVTYCGLRATGNFRDRELELFWPEAGSSVPIQLGLSHLRSHIDWHRADAKSRAHALKRHCESMEALGIRVAVIDDGTVTYATDPDHAFELVAESCRKAPGRENTFLWDSDGLLYRYGTPDGSSVAVAMGPVPFRIDTGYFPPNIENIIGDITLSAVLGMIAIILLTGILSARFLSRRIIHPLTDLQASAKRIQKGDYAASIHVHRQDEFGDTAMAFESMRRQLQEDRQLRETYEKNREELLAGIAHDLATPLTKIQGYTSGILDGIARTPEKQHDYLMLVLHASQQMQRLVHGLFTLSKLELGKIEFHWEILPLSPFLQRYVEEQRDMLAEQGFQIALSKQPARHAPALVRVDAMQLHRVLDNILTNAVKYTEEGRGRLQLSLTETETAVHLTLTDNGKGVKEAELPSLFQAFYRTDKARTQVAKGSGLGLAICQSIIEAMHGKIWAESAVPRGLRICIDLPRAVRNDTMKTNSKES